MCRNIRTLHNFDPPASDEEIRAAALQYVRKISGYTKPSKANRGLRAGDRRSRGGLDDIAGPPGHAAAPKDREVEAAKRRARAEQRFAA